MKSEKVFGKSLWIDFIALFHTMPTLFLFSPFMRDFFALVRRIAEPALVYKKQILIHITTRVLLMISAVFVAERFGQIVDSLSKGSSFDFILFL